MKRFLAILIALLILVSASACGAKPAQSSEPAPASSGGSDKPVESAPANDTQAAPPAAEPTEPQILTVAHRANPTSLFPLTVTNVSANGPFFPLLYDPLISYNSDTGSFEPCLATSWERIDTTHLKLTLRDDVRAHDGSPITASDVIFTIKSGQEGGKLGTYYNRFDLAGCEVVDDYTVILATVSPDPYLEYTLADGVLGIVSEAAVLANGTLEDQNRNPVCGTGPYKLVRWEDDQCVELVRNEDYWGERPYFDTILFNIITDVSARQLNLESGEVQLALDPDYTQMLTLVGNPDFQIINIKQKPFIVAWMNCTKAPFDDINARKAVALALDYESNVQVAMGDYGYVTNSILSNMAEGYAAPDGSYENYFHYDVEAAKAALAESAYPNGFSFTLEYANNGVFDTLGQLMKNQLAVLGIEVNLAPQSSAVVTADAQAGNHDMYMVSPSSPDPFNVLRFLDGRNTFAQSAYTGWKGGDDYYALLDKAKATMDVTERNALLKELQAIINSNVPFLTLGSKNCVFLASANLQRVRLTPMGSVDLRSAYFS